MSNEAISPKNSPKPRQLTNYKNDRLKLNTDLLENKFTSKFKNSGTIANIEECTEDDPNNFKQIVGAVDHRGFKTTFELSMSKGDDLAKQASAAILDAAKLVATKKNEKLFDSATQAWYEELKTLISAINSGTSLSDLIAKDSSNKNKSNIFGPRGVLNFLLAISRIRNVFCNLTEANAKEKVTLAFGDRASYVIRKEAPAPEVDKGGQDIPVEEAPAPEVDKGGQDIPVEEAPAPEADKGGQEIPVDEAPAPAKAPAKESPNTLPEAVKADPIRLEFWNLNNRIKNYKTPADLNAIEQDLNARAGGFGAFTLRLVDQAYIAYIRGQIAYARGQISNAREHYEQAKTIAESSVSTNKDYAESLLRAADMSITALPSDSAPAAPAEALPQGLQNLEELKREIDMAGNSEQYDQIQTQLDSMLKPFSLPSLDQADVAFLNGRLAQKRGQIDKARSQYERSQSIAKNAALSDQKYANKIITESAKALESLPATKLSVEK